MGKELYVGHLSEKVQEEDLRKLFSVVGRVTSIHLIVDADTGEFKRCGYVRMGSDAEAVDAIKTLDGALLIDRVITVSVSNPPPKAAAKPRGKGFVGGGAPGSGNARQGKPGGDRGRSTAGKPPTGKKRH